MSRIGCPVLFFTSVGSPAGVRVALLDDTELPFDLSELDGRVVPGGPVNGVHWIWDGESGPSDWNCNTVTSVSIYEDELEYTRQYEDREVQA